MISFLSEVNRTNVKILTYGIYVYYCYCNFHSFYDMVNTKRTHINRENQQMSILSPRSQNKSNEITMP